MSNPFHNGGGPTCEFGPGALEWSVNMMGNLQVLKGSCKSGIYKFEWKWKGLIKPGDRGRLIVDESCNFTDPDDVIKWTQDIPTIRCSGPVVP